jgi:hypothetical protein
VVALIAASALVGGAFVAVASSATKPPPMVFKAYQTAAIAAQSLPQASFTIVRLDEESYDPGNDFDTETSTYRVPKNGRYHFDGRVGVVSPVVPRRLIVALYVNDIEVSRGQDGLMGGDVSGHNVSDTLFLQEGDLVTLRIWTNATSGDAVDRGSEAITRLSGFRVK